MESWHNAPRVSADCAALFFVPPAQCSKDLPARTFRWLRAAGATLRRNHGLVRLILRGDGRLDAGLPEEHYALAGLIKTARHEWPEVACRIIDADGATTNDEILRESFREGPVETCLLGGQANGIGLKTFPQAASLTALDVPEGSLMIVTGGARGVTAECAIALAEATRPTLLLLGRSPLPAAEPDWLAGLDEAAAVKKTLLARRTGKVTPRELEAEYRRIEADREMRRNIARMREHAAAVDYRPVDVRDADAVRIVISEARAAYGPVRGILHGSGVLADKLLLDKTDEQFDSVYSTKVAGVDALLAATVNDPLRFVALFSSSTGRFGRTGQGDYAAANEYLNATARRLAAERPGCRTVALNWGPWEGGMVTPSLKRIFEAEGVGLIPERDGAGFLVSELSQDGPPEVVVLGPVPSGSIEFMVSEDTIPALSDHRLNGRCVLPVALAVEYMAESAVRKYAGLTLERCENLKVMHPVIAPAKVEGSIVERGRDGESLTVDATLSADGRPCFRATLKLTPGVCCDQHLEPDPVVPLAGLYGTDLFHGPAWQVIASLNLDDDVTARAATTGPARRMIRDNSIRNWHAEPLALDAVLQSVIVWTRRSRGLPSLPAAIGRLTIHRRPRGSPVGIRVSVAPTTGSVVRASAVVSDEAGVWMTADGIEHVCSGSLRSAFFPESS